MPTHVALLRAVNVGGRSLAMADLRSAVTALGHSEVATYIQSGNVVFSAGRRSTAALAGELEETISRLLNSRVGVVVLSRRQLQAVVEGNPYPDEENLRLVHAAFMPAAIDGAGRDALAAAQDRARERGSDDVLRVGGSTVYLHTPGGFGRSVLMAELGRGAARRVMAAGTARNWATVIRLLEMLGA